jgi:hypothetical protein
MDPTRAGALLIAAILVVACGSSTGPGSPARPSVAPSASARAAFRAGPSLATARAKQTATLLDDGRVLLIGGYGEDVNAPDAERFDPTSATISTAGTLGAGRYDHTATLLEDQRVLVVAGSGEDPAILASVELWDPQTSTFSGTGSIDGVRMLHTATRLADGRVLIVGGWDGGALPDAWLWDPRTSRFTATGGRRHARAGHTATLLKGGRVLIVGGPAVAEVWDPSTERFGDAGTLPSARWWPTSTLLDDGRVVVIGGFEGERFASGAPGIPDIEIWDPETSSFAPAGSLEHKRGLHTATRCGGRVLIVGGMDFDAGTPPILAGAETWDPSTMTVTAAADLSVPRAGHTATCLDDGRVFIVAGSDTPDTVLASTEIWTP